MTFGRQCNHTTYMTSPAVHPSHMQGMFLRAVILPKVLQTERSKTQNLALLGSLGVLVSVCHLEYYLLFIVITGVQISNLIIQYMKPSTEHYVCVVVY